MKRLSKTKVLVLGLAVLLLGLIAGMIISMSKNLNADSAYYVVISYEELRKQATTRSGMGPIVDDVKLAEKLGKMLNYFSGKGWKFCAVLDTYEMIIFEK